MVTPVLSDFDPPDPDDLEDLIVVRLAKSSSTVGGRDPVYASNTVRRAMVIPGDVMPREWNGLPGASSTAELYTGPPDPRLKAGDLIGVLPRLVGDPDAPAPGDVWADVASGMVRRAVAGGPPVDLGPIPAETSDVLTIPGTDRESIRTPTVLTAEGPAVNVGNQGVLYRIECGGGG